MRGFHLDELEKKRSNLQSKMTRKTNTVADMLYSFKNTEGVREQLQQIQDDAEYSEVIQLLAAISNGDRKEHLKRELR